MERGRTHRLGTGIARITLLLAMVVPILLGEWLLPSVVRAQPLCEATGTESVVTEKPDYRSGEIMSVTGTGDWTSCTITIDIYSIHSSPTAGVAPLTVTFSVFGTPAPVSVDLDYDGNGTVDFSGPSLDGQLFTYGQPGLYFPRATITDAQGNQSTKTTLVQVYDRAALDQSLQGLWATLRSALQQGDVDGAVGVFALSSRDAYRDQLRMLAGAGALGQVAADLGPIALVEVHENAVEYDLRAVQNGVQYSFYVRFVVDSDGVWRLWVF